MPQVYGMQRTEIEEKEQKSDGLLPLILNQYIC